MEPRKIFLEFIFKICSHFVMRFKKMKIENGAKKRFKKMKIKNGAKKH